jgi:hypothetical protein
MADFMEEELNSSIEEVQALEAELKGVGVQGEATMGTPIRSNRRFTIQQKTDIRTQLNDHAMADFMNVDTNSQQQTVHTMKITGVKDYQKITNINIASSCRL